MWQLNEPKPAKLIIAILAADDKCLKIAHQQIIENFGTIDLTSPAWSFTLSNYYRDEVGPTPLKQIVSIEKLIHPGDLPAAKHRSNQLEQQIAETLDIDLPRPVNLDPGIIEPAKLILATTKDYSHRIYIGQQMYAEVTLIYDKGAWKIMPYTYPDYRQPEYHQFLTKVRTKLMEQLKSLR